MFEIEIIDPQASRNLPTLVEIDGVRMFVAGGALVDEAEYARRMRKRKEAEFNAYIENAVEKTRD